jgi:2-polyprenyl-6-methoxyphenol hydroxylase-like FAD-dependent oxidoreductase
MTDTDLRIAIVGAGIGGLSLALGLRERGVRAEVFEQAPELTEIGAAIALSANATREYARLGLVDELAAASTIPTELIYRHWQDGSRIAAHPVRKDDAYVCRFGAPYFGIHRADLQKTLSIAFGVEHLHLGCRLTNLVPERDSVMLEFANGRRMPSSSGWAPTHTCCTTRSAAMESRSTSSRSWRAPRSGCTTARSSRSPRTSPSHPSGDGTPPSQR